MLDYLGKKHHFIYNQKTYRFSDKKAKNRLFGTKTNCYNLVFFICK